MKFFFCRTLNKKKDGILASCPAAIGLYNQINKPATKLNTKIIDSVKGIAPNDFRKWHGAKPAAQRELEKTFHNVEPRESAEPLPHGPETDDRDQILYNISRAEDGGEDWDDVCGPFQRPDVRRLEEQGPTPTGSYATNTTNRAMQNLMGIKTRSPSERRRSTTCPEHGRPVRPPRWGTGPKTHEKGARGRGAEHAEQPGRVPPQRHERGDEQAHVHEHGGRALYAPGKTLHEALDAVANEANDGKRASTLAGSSSCPKTTAPTSPTVDKTRGAAPCANVRGQQFRTPAALDARQSPLHQWRGPLPLAAENLDQASKHAAVRAPKVRRGKRKNKRRAKATRGVGKGEAPRPSRALAA